MRRHINRPIFSLCGMGDLKTKKPQCHVIIKSLHENVSLSVVE